MYNPGVDITSVERIKKSLEKPGFLKKVFSEKETELFFDKEKPKYQSLAANFAAKEAFSKALGTGVRGFELYEVEILRDELGRPFFNFYGKAREIVAKGGYKARVSLSHEGDNAIAFVILEEEGRIINL